MLFGSIMFGGIGVYLYWCMEFVVGYYFINGESLCW